MANFKTFRWNFSSSTNSEISRSVEVAFSMVVCERMKNFPKKDDAREARRRENVYIYVGRYFSIEGPQYNQHLLPWWPYHAVVP